jgi:hypothetical protein
MFEDHLLEKYYAQLFFQATYFFNTGLESQLALNAVACHTQKTPKEITENAFANVMGYRTVSKNRINKITGMQENPFVTHLLVNSSQVHKVYLNNRIHMSFLLYDCSQI